MSVKEVLNSGKTKEDVLEEIDKYLNEHPDAELIDYYYGFYDEEEGDYIRVKHLEEWLDN